MHAAASFVRMDMAGVECGGAGGDEAATDEAEGERPPTLSLPHDVSHYRGQNLVQGLAASNAAAVLTGIPLISFAASSSGGLANTKLHQHQQHHHQESVQEKYYDTVFIFREFPLPRSNYLQIRVNIHEIYTTGVSRGGRGGLFLHGGGRGRRRRGQAAAATRGGGSDGAALRAESDQGRKMF